jgi:co-chaperonin GroES (HSP10)
MSLRPLGRRVFISPVYPEQVSPSGIWLPQHTSLDANGNILHQSHNPLYANQGIVVALPKPNGRPLEVQLHDFVIFSPYSASLVKTATDTLIAIDADDIMAVVENTDEQEVRQSEG